jgi:DNA-binding Lrp family transcriptional regulator
MMKVSIRQCVAEALKPRHNAEMPSKVTNITLNEKDQALLDALRANAREPVASLARKLGISRTTVQDRLRRLEEQGVIAGYTVRTNKTFLAQGFSAWVSVAVEPRKQIEVSKMLAKFPQIEVLHAVSGKVDLVALVRANSAEAMDEILDKITILSGITHIETAVILSTKLDRRQS